MLRLRVCFAIGSVTLREIMRQKLLYNIFAFAIFLFAMAWLAARVSYVSPDRIVLDFGMTAMNLSGAAIAILVGASLINREFERRTIFVALSHPISRIQFLIGKFFGVVLVLCLNWLLFTVALSLILLVTGGHAYFGATLAAAFFFQLLQFIVLGAIALFFSTFTTTTLGIVFTIGIALVGTNISQIRLLATHVEEPLSRALLNAIALVWPNMEHFNLGLNVTYDLPVAAKTVATAILYAICISAVAILAGGAALEKRES